MRAIGGLLWVVLCLIYAVWVIYLTYKIAQHVGAWPFA